MEEECLCTVHFVLTDILSRSSREERLDVVPFNSH